MAPHMKQYQHIRDDSIASDIGNEIEMPDMAEQELPPINNDGPQQNGDSHPIPGPVLAAAYPNPGQVIENNHRPPAPPRNAPAGAQDNQNQDNKLIQRPPRVIIVIPPWFSNFFLVQRAWKTALFSFGLVAAIGTSIFYAREAIVFDTPNIRGSGNDFNMITSVSGLPPPPGTRLPHTVNIHFIDFESPLSSSDIPFYWHIPRAGGKTMMNILGSCLDMVQASDVGGRDGQDAEKNLDIIETDMGRYVNVNTYTPEGINAAVRKKIVESKMVDVISSPYLVLAAGLFTKFRRGRIFTFFRHPVERANSYFHYISHADFDPYYEPSLANISVERYANLPDDRREFNWMVKNLVGKPEVLSEDLTENDLNTAKEFLRRKFIIGLLDNKGDSMLRFEMYFQWQYKEADDKVCEEKLLHWSYQNQNDHPSIVPGTDAYYFLERRNKMDMELYQYAKVLYDEQESFFYQ